MSYTNSTSDRSKLSLVVTIFLFLIRDNEYAELKFTIFMWIINKLSIATPFLIIIFSLFPRIDVGSSYNHTSRPKITDEFGQTIFQPNSVPLKP